MLDDATNAPGRRVGLCGFLSPAGGDDVDGLLAGMEQGLASLAGRPAEDMRCATAAGGAVSCFAGFELADTAEIDGWLAAIRGMPRWADAELAGLARDRGHAVALIEGHSRYGADVLQRLKGAFSFAILKPDGAYGLVAVDRMGHEPMCWGQTAGGDFVFGSTAKAVRTWPGIGGELSRQAIYNFLYFYYVPSPETIFRNVRKLRPGSCVVFEGGRAQERTYWTMPYGDVTTAGAEALKTAIHDDLSAAVAAAVADVDNQATGVFLSGGLDSSTMAGLVRERTGSVRTFTIGFADAGYDETPFARITAGHFGASHQEYFVTPEDAAAALPQIATAYDEPFANSSAIPTYFCARLAREYGIDVMVAGDGGDELFAGNERYASMRRFDLYGHIPALLRKALLDPLLAPAFWSAVPVLGKAHRLMKRYYMPLARRIYTYNPFCDLSAKQVLLPEFLQDINEEAPLKVIEYALGRHRSADDLQTMMGLDLTLTLADNDLRKVTRMCQLAGIGVRYPMLDDDVVALAAGMPSELLMPGNQLRGFYKQAMRGYLHDETLSKAKHGFGLPVNNWSRHEPVFRELIVGQLKAFGGRSIVSQPFLSRLIASCEPGSRDPIVSSAYDMAVFEMWLAANE